MTDVYGRNHRLDPGTLTGSQGHIFSARSGAMTTISASADVAALRNAYTDGTILLVSQLVVDWVTTTAFGTGQAVVFGVFKVDNFTAFHSGGDPKTLAIYDQKKISTATNIEDNVDMAISDVDAIDTAMHDTVGEPFAVLSCGLGTTPSGRLEYYPEDTLPIVLSKNEGLVIRPLIELGADGVGNLSVQIHCLKV